MTTLTPLDLRDFPPVEENIEVPETLSQSLMAKHNKCPRSAYLSRKYKTSSIPMDRGSAWHLFAQQASELMIEEGEPTMPGEMAREMADAVMAEHPEFVLPTEEQDAVRLMAWNWAEATVLDLEAVIGVEVPLELEIGGWRFTSRIDLVEVFGSSLHLTDYKTSLSIRKREDVQRGFQGQAYGLSVLDGAVQESGLALGAGIQDVWFWETYPRYRTEEGPLIKKDGSWTRPELAEFRVSLERNIQRFEDSLETGDWPARDGSHCSECPAQRECPIPPHLREIDEITTPEDAQNAFSRRLALERESRSLQAGMRGYVQENGPIYLPDGDLVFDAALTQSRSVNWDAVKPGERLPSDAIQMKPSTKFAKRKLTEEERSARD